MKQWIKPLIFTLIILAIAVTVYISGAGRLFTLENLTRYREIVKNFVARHYFLSVLIFIAIYTAVTGLSIPGATVLTIAGGFLFSTIPAAIYVNAGATLGASASFMVARYLVGSVIQEKFAEQLVQFNSEIKANGVSYLLTLRFIPIFPFFLINILAGMTRVPFFTFVWTTSAGIVPGSVVYAFAGSNLADLKSVSGILSWPIILALLLLAFFSLSPAVLKKILPGKKDGSSK
jgi:uncharacterized membrane protein YdjX (TVP38/TMEM64 family)